MKMTGYIDSVDHHRGFGFIVGDADEIGSRFFHATAVLSPWTLDNLRAGMRVEYQPSFTPKGPRAIKVKVMEEIGEGEKEVLLKVEESVEEPHEKKPFDPTRGGKYKRFSVLEHKQNPKKDKEAEGGGNK